MSCIAKGFGLWAVAALVGCATCPCDRSAAMPRISVFGGAIATVAQQQKVTLARAAEMLRDAGVTGFDAAYNDKNLAAYAGSVLEPANLYGWGTFLDADNGRKTSEAFVATAVTYRVSRIMCVLPPFTDGKPNESEYQKMKTGLAYLVAHARARGITVMIEDFGGENNPCSHALYNRRLLQDLPELSFALDSGNLYYANRGESILDLLAFAQGRIRHVHLKDLTTADHHTYATLGLGGVENRTVVRTMRARGYDGWYTLENQVGDDRLEDVVRQVAVLRHWLKD